VCCFSKITRLIKPLSPRKAWPSGQPTWSVWQGPCTRRCAVFGSACCTRAEKAVDVLTCNVQSFWTKYNTIINAYRVVRVFLFYLLNTFFVWLLGYDTSTASVDATRNCSELRLQPPCTNLRECTTTDLRINSYTCVKPFTNVRESRPLSEEFFNVDGTFVVIYAYEKWRYQSSFRDWWKKNVLELPGKYCISLYSPNVP